MTNYRKLYDGIGRAAWGYFFIYFDININTVSIIPSFVGYLLFLSAINCLCDEERELDLLKILVGILTAWHFASWIASWGGVDLDGVVPVIDIIIGVVNIYFHFQLLTNLASVAAKYQPDECEMDKKLLRYRTVQTLILTAMVVIGHFARWLDGVGVLVSASMAIVYLVVGILLMKALFDLRRCLPSDTVEEDGPDS